VTGRTDHAGADASPVLFDPDIVGEHKDYVDPLAPPAGIDTVWGAWQLRARGRTGYIGGRLARR
jgi:N-acyl-D-aspartate/D-glutamate deacylase